MRYLFTLAFIINILFSQENIGGKPYSFDNSLMELIPNIIMPTINIDELLYEDANSAPGTPFRYGNKFNVHLNPENSGVWEYNNNNRIWRISIISHEAYALSLELDDFYLSETATLFVYNQDRTEIYGAYTNNNNNIDNIFDTPLVSGNNIILELLVTSEFDDSQINISSVIHDYRDILNIMNQSRSCGDNVICPDADPYEDQINAAAWLDMGGYICSGAMINNTDQDLTPYFLTADHCVAGESPGTFRFYFNYETTSCGGSSASYGSYAYGSTLRSRSYDMDPDFALLEINGTIYDSWDVFYAGWNRSASASIISCGVHHPGGDPKKINYDNDYAVSDTWNGGAYSHWRVSWDEGGTEGGSSGSPVYDNNGRIVGQLSGGSGDCNSSNDTEDYYGKFSRAFNDVSQWLDPLNTNASEIDGTYDGTNNSDSDGDGVADNQDSDDNNPYICSDDDSDTCDDCTNGFYDTYNDGWDYDADGLCDAGDADDDNDGSMDNQDSNDNNPFICSDTDNDTCDDCASGIYDPANDGLDDDGEGVCNSGDFTLGDASMDGIVNILDVVVVVSHIMGVDILNGNAQQAADVNQDGQINIIDVVTIVNFILG